MPQVRDTVRIRVDGKAVEVIALFDTGAGKTYVSDRVAEELGYLAYERPINVPLAVHDKDAEVIGYIPAATLEVAGQVLPEKETLGVVKGLREDLIIGLNVIEPYEISFEGERIVLKRIPPTSFLF